MSLSNFEKEMLWVNGWNDLTDIHESVADGYILIPEYAEVSLEEAKGWIQEQAYLGHKAEFRVDYYRGKKSVFINIVL